MYYNIVEDQVQDMASVTIGKTLARLAEAQSDGTKTGITFMNGATEDTEVSEREDVADMGCKSAVGR